MSNKYYDEYGDEILIYSKRKLTENVITLDNAIRRLTDKVISYIPNNYIITVMVNGEIITITQQDVLKYPNKNQIKAIVLTNINISSAEVNIIGIMAMNDEEFKEYNLQL